jgi:hypothetical protein
MTNRDSTRTILKATAGRSHEDRAADLHVSGHSGGTTRSSLIDQDVDELAFHCWALDLTDPADLTDRPATFAEASHEMSGAAE